MNTATLSGWQSLARTEFPGAPIVGDGAYVLIPCFPKAKAFLFQTLAEARSAVVLCSPFCGGKHRGLILRAPTLVETFKSPSAGRREKD